MTDRAISLRIGTLWGTCFSNTLNKHKVCLSCFMLPTFGTYQTNGFVNRQVRNSTNLKFVEPHHENTQSEQVVEHVRMLGKCVHAGVSRRAHIMTTHIGQTCIAFKTMQNMCKLHVNCICTSRLPFDIKQAHARSNSSTSSSAGAVCCSSSKHASIHRACLAFQSGPRTEQGFEQEVPFG